MDILDKIPYQITIFRVTRKAFDEHAPIASRTTIALAKKWTNIEKFSLYIGINDLFINI